MDKTTTSGVKMDYGLLFTLIVLAIGGIAGYWATH